MMQQLNQSKYMVTPYNEERENLAPDRIKQMSFKQKVNPQNYLNNKVLTGSRIVGGGLSNIKYSNLMLYDAVVDADGNGDFRDIQSAIDAGRTRIFVRAGTYVLDADIVLDSDIMIVGESKYNTIIDCNNSAYKITAEGDDVYSTGSITLTNGSATVTGSGTSWNANLEAGDYIATDEHSFKIASVDSDTQVTIETNYYGETSSGLGYYAGTFKHNIQIHNITVKNQNLSSLAGMIDLKSVINSTFNDIIITEGDTAYSYSFRGRYIFNSIFRNITIDECGYYGFYFQHLYHSEIINVDANNNNGAGLYITVAKNNKFSNIISNYNDIGIYLQSSSERNIFSDIITNYNGSYGFQIYVVTDEVILNNVISDYNGTTGFDISDTKKASLNNYSARYNGSYGVRMHGNYVDENRVIGGLITNSGKHGIFCQGINKCIILGNNLKDNSQDANDTYSDIHLQDTSTYNNINSNNIDCTETNKSKYGIREASSNDDYNLIDGNIVQNAVTANISTQGANTVTGDNI